MQKNRKAGKFISILLLISMLWFSYGIINFILQEASNENLDYIPENATEVYRINGQVFLKNTLNSLILHEDQELSEMLTEYRKTRSSEPMKPLGIVFDSEIIEFKLPEGEEIVTGYLINLRSPLLFERNIPSFVGKNAAIAIQGNVGLVLLQEGQAIPQKRLNALAQRLIAKKSTVSKERFTAKSGSILSMWNTSKGGLTTSMSAFIQGNNLNFSGSISGEKPIQKKQPWLKPDGLHFSSAVIPDSWNKYIQNAFGAVGIELPKITSISINYYGCTFISEPVFLIAPNANMSLTFESPVEVDSLFKSFELSSVGAPKNFQNLNVYGEKYLVGSFAPNKLLIYSSNLSEIKYEEQKNAIQISGSPDYLFKIEGDGFIRRLMGMSPLMAASQAMGSEISTISIEGKRDKNNSILIDGSVQFKKGEFPLNAIFKFLIRSKIFE